jgi:ABC-type Fe3+-hydroxamate transport system substrate-binding protein
MIEEKIGEALGLEKAAQKAVEELDSRIIKTRTHEKIKQNEGTSQYTGAANGRTSPTSYRIRRIGFR